MELTDATYSGSVATTDTRTLKNNVKFLKKRSGVEKLIAVVKANAYGHGAAEIARTLENDVSQFAVATPEEAVELREAGIEAPILHLGVPEISFVEIYSDYQLMATVSQPDHFKLLPSGTGYHLNFDTGMRRVGFFPDQVPEVLSLIEAYPELSCEGYYSHFATADDPGSDAVCRQHELFRKIRDKMPESIPAHMSNSAAVFHYDLDHFDMIRCGIGLFGYAPGTVQAEDVTPVLEWKTRIVQVRKIRKGDPVSYTGSWNAPRDGYLATLPVGYADGVPRTMTNRLHVEIEGEFYPQVGNVTMDYIMVFLGDRNIEEGTEVGLMGGKGWRANEWAEASGSITHEILCGLTPRVQRRYNGLSDPGKQAARSDSVDSI